MVYSVYSVRGPKGTRVYIQGRKEGRKEAFFSFSSGETIFARRTRERESAQSGE